MHKSEIEYRPNTPGPWGVTSNSAHWIVAMENGKRINPSKTASKSCKP